MIELKSQRAEIDKLKKKDEKTLKDSTKRLTILTKISTPTPEELQEITKLNVIITELKNKKP